jgi:Putative beta-barrel porin-2, OmpL-like. bbp2
MISAKRAEQSAEYVLAERRLRGTREEVLQELDSVIESLVAFRHTLIAQQLRLRRSPPPRRLRYLRLVAIAIVVVLTASQAWAQSSEPAEPTETAQPTTPAPTDENPWRNIKFGATLEGYYQYNWNKPPDRSVALHAYDTRANTFGLQQVALVFDAAPDVAANRRYGVRVDLQFGQATETVQGGAANEPRPDVYRHIWQAYGSYVFPVGNGLQTDFGKFASMLGYETNYAKDNQARAPTCSTSCRSTTPACASPGR